MDVARIHLAEIPPTHCSSCFSQVPQKRHVDFSAFYDGPVFGDIEVAGGHKITIDDLILCEDCVKAAAQLVGLDDVEREREEIQRLKDEAEGLRGQVAQALAGAAALREAHDHIDGLADLMTKPKTRQKAKAA